MFLETIAMAPAASGSGQGSGASSMFMMGWIVFMIAIFYFVMIRPQRRREKERKAMINAVKSGQSVLMTNGILGEVKSVKDTTLIVTIAEGTQVEVVKSAISQVIEKGEKPENVQA